jgi:hypothetical protein
MPTAAFSFSPGCPSLSRQAPGERMPKPPIDVFISYKREDYARVDRLAATLADLGLDVWHDASLVAGETWPDRLEKVAHSALAIVVCWTEAAKTSKWIQREMAIGIERGVLVPVRFGPGRLPKSLGDLHVPNLTDWNGELDHTGFQQFAKGLEKPTGKSVASWVIERAGGQNPAAVAALRAHLVKLARAGAQPIDYTEALRVVASTFRRGAATPLRTLFGTLDVIADQNRVRREPPLFGLVVNTAEDLPGRGYFEKHCFLRHTSPIAAKLHAAQLKDVWAYGWPEDG